MWGDEFTPQFDLILWVDTPTDVRVERFGDRILVGGDMYTNHEEFIEWAKTYDTNNPPERCRALHEEWILKVSCPVLRLDGSKPVTELMREVEQVLLPSFPAELTASLSGYTCTKDRIGCSSAGVFRYERNSDVLYLKIAEISDEIRRERDLLVWLKGKVPVPDVLYYGEQDGYAFLLMTKADGFMACDCTRDAVGEQDKVHEPITQTVKLLANALLMLQTVDIQECPFENTFDHKLKAACAVRPLAGL